MSAFIIEEQYGGKKPKTCDVTICCSCGHTFKAKMYDIHEHDSAYVKCPSCGRKYGAHYEGWIIEEVKA